MRNTFNTILFFTVFTASLYAQTSVYSISVCSTHSYEEGVECKEHLLEKYADEVFIVRMSKTNFRTNYGKFESYDQAKKVMKALSQKIQKERPFIVRVENNESDIATVQTQTAPQVFKNDDENKTVQKDINNSAIMTDSNQTNRVETVVAKGLVDDEQKVVYLTFDDGPVNGTDNILDVLEEEHIPATMFYIGKQILNNKDIYKRTLLCDSVSIGNHTYCHANGKYRDFYRNANILVQDINRNNEIIARDKKSVSTSPFLPVRLAGRNVFRLPRLNRDDNAINPKERSIEHIGYEKVAKEGFYIYGWDVEWTHGAKGTPNESPSEIASLINKLQAHKSSREPNKIILLMHDYMFKSTLHGKENLLALIHLLKKSGWKFSTIENYLAD